MSTTFCQELATYVANTKQLSLRKVLLQASNQSLTGTRVSKTGRPNLYGRRANEQILKHIIDRFDAAEADEGEGAGPGYLPDQAECDGFDGGAREAPCRAAEPGFARMGVNRHGRVGIGHGKCVRACVLSCPGNESNVRNQWRKLDPKRAPGGSLTGQCDNFRGQRGVAAELHTSLLNVGAGDIEFVGGEALGVLEDPDD